MFEAEFFRSNRNRLRTLFTGTAPIVLTANGLLQRATDETFPFKQDSNFWYLTGIDHPDIILVMDKDKEYLIVPEMSHAREMFDGALDLDALRKISGIEEILIEKQGWKQLSTRIKRVTNVAVIAPPPSYIDYYGMYTNPARKRLVTTIKKYNKNITLLDLRQHLQIMRMVKQPVELEAIKKAVEITVEVLKKVETMYRQGKYKNEFDIELALTKYFIERGAEGHGFSPIIAAGAKATQLHPFKNDMPITVSQPLLLDIGAEYQHYAADISRAWANSPSKRYQQIHEAVKEVADYAMNILKPGVIIMDYEKQIQQFMGEKLRELGLIKTIDRDSVRHYFPSMTSHFLGLDVHDIGDYDRPLEPGVVLTVEPGIYIPEEGIGVRIEDDVLITKDGVQNLSEKLSRSW